MSHPASKATAVAFHFIAYIPLAGVTLSVFMTLKTLILQVVLFVDKGGWAWVKCHQAMNLGFLQILLDDRLSPFRRQLLLGAAKLANTPALLVFLGSALACLLVGKGLQAIAKAME
jgi:ABC-type spermidine/putrescine transport system permease subunit II